MTAQIQNRLKERASAVFNYLKEVFNLGLQPVRKIENHKDFLLFSHKLPDSGQIRVYSESEDGQILLEIIWQDIPSPPSLPDNLVNWVEDIDDPDKEPRIIESLIIEDLEEEIEVDVFFSDDPGRNDSFLEYLELWHQWVADSLIVKEVQDVFRKLFDINERLKYEEQIELIWGHGLLLWAVQDYKIKYPLVNQTVNIAYLPSEKLIRISLPDDTPPALEFDALIDIRATADYSSLKKSFDEINYDPDEKESYFNLFKEISGSLSPSGIVKEASSDESYSPSTDLRIIDSWVLFVRKRRQNVIIRDVEKMNEIILSDSTTISEGLCQFLKDPDENPPDWGNIEPRNEWDALLDKEVLFPLQSNREQIQILDYIEHGKGIVVQGPPGTGKSHTIANLICHFMAQGKRVLVTAQKDQPLSVLYEMIPADLQPLCINLLRNARDSRQKLDIAISCISDIVSTSNPTQLNQNIISVQKKIDDLRKQIVQKANEIKSFSSAQTTPVIYQGLDEPKLPSKLTLRIKEQKEKHAWLLDMPEFKIDYITKGEFSKVASLSWEYPLSLEDFDSLKTIRRRLVQEKDDLGYDIPDLNKVLSCSEFEAVYSDCRKSMTIEKMIKNRMDNIVFKNENITAINNALSILKKYIDLFEGMRESWQINLFDMLENKNNLSVIKDVVNCHNDIVSVYKKIEQKNKQVHLKNFSMPDNYSDTQLLSYTQSVLEKLEIGLSPWEFYSNDIQSHMENAVLSMANRGLPWDSYTDSVIPFVECVIERLKTGKNRWDVFDEEMESLITSAMYSIKNKNAPWECFDENIMILIENTISNYQEIGSPGVHFDENTFDAVSKAVTRLKMNCEPCESFDRNTKKYIMQAIERTKTNKRPWKFFDSRRKKLFYKNTEIQGVHPETPEEWEAALQYIEEERGRRRVIREIQIQGVHPETIEEWEAALQYIKGERERELALKDIQVQGAHPETVEEWQVALQYVRGEQERKRALQDIQIQGVHPETIEEWEAALKYIKGERERELALKDIQIQGAHPETIEEWEAALRHIKRERERALALKDIQIQGAHPQTLEEWQEASKYIREERNKEAALSCIKIDKKPPMSQKEWDDVSKRIELNLLIHDFQNKWDAFAKKDHSKKIGIPLQRFNSPEAIEEMLRKLKSPFRCSQNMLPKLVDSLEALIALPNNYNICDHLNDIYSIIVNKKDLLNFAQAQDKKSKSIQYFYQIGNNPHGIVYSFIECLEDGCIENSQASDIIRKWNSNYTRLQNLESLYRDYENYKNILDKLQITAPKWAKKLKRLSPTENEDILFPSFWRESWQANVIEKYLETIFQQAKAIATLHKEKESLEKELLKAKKELVLLKTKLGLIKRISEKDVQALRRWKLAIKKLGGGKSKWARKRQNTVQKESLQAQNAVPVWIMSMYRVSETIPSDFELFDVVIVDEASQCDIRAFPVLARGKKMIIVGDDQQISPSAVGVSELEMQKLISEHIDGVLPSGHFFDLKTSLYDLAGIVFGLKGTLMLKEHFRCVPEIIEFSNHLCYNGNILPLRNPPKNKRLVPEVQNIYVHEGYREDRRNVNKLEAQAICEKIKDMVNSKQYKDKTLGVISLTGYEQAKYIQQIIHDYLSPEQQDKIKFRVGDSYAFQGDERDVMFLSMVVGGQDDRQSRSLTSDTYRQRFNVAVSRARDQLLVFHSVRLGDDLKNPNDLRYKLLDFSINGTQSKQIKESVKDVFESPFEEEVYHWLVKRGYSVSPQVKVGHYRIDLVVEGENNRLAVECDGERYHPPEKWWDDSMRQRQLERVGWRFVRIWGSQYYSDKEETMMQILPVLDEMEIYPKKGCANCGSIFENHAQFCTSCGEKRTL